MIHGFKPLRYSDAAGSLQNLVSQPYDKIPPDEKARLEDASPHNVVRLIRGETSPDDTQWYAGVRPRVEAWLKEGVLVQDETPSLYAYRQRFTAPDGTVHTRTGVTGVFDLAHADKVLHHERTHGRAKIDRLRLLEASQIHFGQIFLVRHEGPSLHVADLPDFESAPIVKDRDGAEHSFQRIENPDLVQGLEEAFASSGFVIADGHHRFTVATQYAKDHPASGGKQQVMVTVVDVDDPGLVVLPTHRLLSGLPTERTMGILPFLQAVGAEPFPLLDDPTSFLEALRERGPGTVGVIARAGAFLWNLDLRGREGVDALDTQRLDEDVITPLLRDLDIEDHLSYARDALQTITKARSGEADLAFLLNPIPPRRVTDIAARGELMPQKSTDFFPKMLTGFALQDMTRP